MIIGNPGSGKSTLARKMNEKSGLPVIHVDQIYWQPGWNMRTAEEAKALVLEAASNDRWIIEGNYFSSFEQRINRADNLITLDFPTHISLFRVLMRTLRYWRRDRPDNSKDCPERFDWEFTKWIYHYRRDEQPKIIDLITGIKPAVMVYHLRNPADVRSFLETYDG
jgi:adenylate kinase family enzyme